MPHSRDEVKAAFERYIAVRDGINAGQRHVGRPREVLHRRRGVHRPGVGRVEGIEEMKATVFGEAMVGLEVWTFPTEFFMIDGDNIVVKWWQVLPGTRADGKPYAQSGYSTLVYAGDGKFCYEEDLLNMAHVMEDVRDSGFRFSPQTGAPPKNPNRDFSRPPQARR